MTNEAQATNMEALAPVSSASEASSPKHHSDSSTPGSTNTAGLLSLPAELLETILDLALLSDSPIEFAPFRDLQTASPNDANFTAFQYQHVLRFQRQIRPFLVLLSVNKGLRIEASRVYHGKNTFRFTNHYAWLVLARYFDLIGKDNVQRLRHIEISLPGCGKYVRKYEYDEFFVRHLSPFGMTDLPNYASIFYAGFSQRHELVPVRDPLTTLRGINNLEKLDFLIHGQYLEKRCDTYKRQTFFMDLPFDKSLTFQSQPKLDVTLVNFSPRIIQPRDPPIYLSSTENPPADAEWYARLDSETIQAGKAVVGCAKVRGWKIVDREWEHVWPKDFRHRGSVDELEKNIEGMVGWQQREELEYLVQGALRTCPGDMIFLKKRNCIKCWGEGGFDGCVCDDRPALLRRRYLEAKEPLIGNPGSDLLLSAHRESLVWKKSWAVRDSERRAVLGLEVVGRWLRENEREEERDEGDSEKKKQATQTRPEVLQIAGERNTVDIYGRVHDAATRVYIGGGVTQVWDWEE